MGGSLAEFNSTTLRVAVAAIHAHYDDRKRRYSEARSLAILGGMVSNMPYMQDADRKKFQADIQADDNDETSTSTSTNTEITREQLKERHARFREWVKKINPNPDKTIIDVYGEVIS